jgi:hypothetical protein
MATKTTTRYLLRRNDDCVAQQIESTNKLLIQPYNDMIAALKNAGVVDVTMDTIKAIAKNGVEEIESLIPAPQPDVFAALQNVNAKQTHVTLCVVMM